MALLQRISHGSLRESVYQTIRSAIMNGQFKPGDPVTIMRMAEMVGTSAMPVREALRQLVAEDALTMLPNRSVIVPQLTMAEFDDLTALRCHLEGIVAFRAAERRKEEDLEQIEAIHTELAEAARRRDAEAFLRLNWRFHFSIYRAAHSDFYISLVERFWLRVGPLIWFCLNDSLFDIASEFHQMAFLGLVRKDGAAVRMAVERDITEASILIRKACSFSENPEKRNIGVM